MITKVDKKEDDLKEYNISADKIQNLLDQYSANKEDVEKKQAYVNDRFRKIRSKLTERQADIEEITEKAQDFDTNLTQSRKSVSDIGKKFATSLKKPKDEKKVKDAVDEVDVILANLAAKKADLQADYTTGDWLIERSKRDPLMVHEVQSRLDEAQKPIDQLIKKLNDYKAELFNDLHLHQELSQKVDDLEDKLRAVEDKGTYLKPVSAKFTVARGQQEQFKVSIFVLLMVNYINDLH